eukprot:m.761673 g.761673  ORF g.761673 m.761673 type:complete len:76 (-) comp23205_c1_seq38:2551-2778(-)
MQADMSEVISIHLLELKHQMASELNSCDAFKYPQAIADANNGAGNNARAPRPSVTGEGERIMHVCIRSTTVSIEL